MRPVADLTRRRLGDGLPLDPSATVAEFTAHVTHRRDMFFAAQISTPPAGDGRFPAAGPGRTTGTTRRAAA